MSPALVPARNTNTGAQKCVIQRVKYSADRHVRIAQRIAVTAPVHEEVAHVVDRHDDDHEATQHVDRREAVSALVGVIADSSSSRRGY